MAQNIIDYVGKILIVDDNFDEKIKDIIEEFAQKGLSVQYWNSKGKKSFTNVRVLILDLDLSNGTIRRGDQFYHTMAAKVLEQIPGPYVVIIYAQDFVNEDIKHLKNAYERITKVPFDKQIEGITGISKGKGVKNVTQMLQTVIDKNDVFKLILTWEKILDNAKDTGLQKFVREKFQNEVINFVKSMNEDVKEEGLSREFISNMLRFLSRYMHRGKDYQILEELLKKIASSSNTKISDQLLQNRSMYFTPDLSEKIWTGDIIENKDVKDFWKYSIVLTPECDVAQDKVENFLVCKGFLIDRDKLKDPLHPIYKIDDKFKLPEMKQGMTPDQFDKRVLDYLSTSLKKQNDRLYPIWNCTVDFKEYFGICFNFQHVNSILFKDFNKKNMKKRISRLDNPYITELIRQFSNY